MGLGRFGGGLDVVRFAVRAGARVTVTDLASEDALAEPLRILAGLQADESNRRTGGAAETPAECPVGYPIEYHLGGHREEDFGPDGPEIVVVNPAVRPDNRYVAMAAAAGKHITSQVELFFQLCPAPIVGITGSNGKSTTTVLAVHLLRAGLRVESAGDRRFASGRDRASGSSGRQVWLGGNIGNEMWLSCVDRIGADDVAVLELSSFQIEQLARIRRGPQVAVITNLTPNHLDRHGTFGAYCEAKEHLFRYQPCDPDRPCVSIFNGDDPVTRAWYERYRGRPGRVCRTFSADDVPAEAAEHFRLPGRANRANLAAALQVAAAFGIGADTLAGAVGSFRGLPHRLQLVCEIDGVRWYDDSKATTTPSSIAALEAFSCPRIVIAGGYDKGVPFDEFAAALVRHAKAVVLIGATAPKIAEAIGAVTGAVAGGGDADGRLIVRFAEDMAQAVGTCAELARPGDVVLLSTACASYDMFDHYEHRAAVFRAEVEKLVTAGR